MKSRRSLWLPPSLRSGQRSSPNPSSSPTNNIINGCHTLLIGPASCAPGAPVTCRRRRFAKFLFIIVSVSLFVWYIAFSASFGRYEGGKGGSLRQGLSRSHSHKEKNGRKEKLEASSSSFGASSTVNSGVRSGSVESGSGGGDANVREEATRRGESYRSQKLSLSSLWHSRNGGDTPKTSNNDDYNNDLEYLGPGVVQREYSSSETSSKCSGKSNNANSNPIVAGQVYTSNSVVEGDTKTDLSLDKEVMAALARNMTLLSRIERSLAVLEDNVEEERVQLVMGASAEGLKIEDSESRIGAAVKKAARTTAHDLIDIQLFAVWPGAMPHLERIVRDMASKFVILDLVLIDWTAEGPNGPNDSRSTTTEENYLYFEENLWRLYSGKGGLKRATMKLKVSQCGGVGPFVVAVVADPNPQYRDEETAHGVDHVNKNMFNAKKLYRQWSGEGGFRVHGTYSSIEAEHDVRILLSKRPYAVAAEALVPLVTRPSTGGVAVGNHLVGSAAPDGDLLHVLLEPQDALANLPAAPKRDVRGLSSKFLSEVNSYLQLKAGKGDLNALKRQQKQQVLPEDMGGVVGPPPLRLAQRGGNSVREVFSIDNPPTVLSCSAVSSQGSFAFPSRMSFLRGAEHLGTEIHNGNSNAKKKGKKSKKSKIREIKGGALAVVDDLLYSRQGLVPPPTDKGAKLLEEEGGASERSRGGGAAAAAAGGKRGASSQGLSTKPLTLPSCNALWFALSAAASTITQPLDAAITPLLHSSSSLLSISASSGQSSLASSSGASGGFSIVFTAAASRHISSSNKDELLLLLGAEANVDVEFDWRREDRRRLVINSNKRRRGPQPKEDDGPSSSSLSLSTPEVAGLSIVNDCFSFASYSEPLFHLASFSPPSEGGEEEEEGLAVEGNIKNFRRDGEEEKEGKERRKQAKSSSSNIRRGKEGRQHRPLLLVLAPILLPFGGQHQHQHQQSILIGQQSGQQYGSDGGGGSADDREAVRQLTECSSSSSGRIKQRGEERQQEKHKEGSDADDGYNNVHNGSTKFSIPPRGAVAWLMRLEVRAPPSSSQPSPATVLSIEDTKKRLLTSLHTIVSAVYGTVLMPHARLSVLEQSREVLSIDKKGRIMATRPLSDLANSARTTSQPGEQKREKKGKRVDADSPPHVSSLFSAVDDDHPFGMGSVLGNDNNITVGHKERLFASMARIATGKCNMAASGAVLIPSFSQLSMEESLGLFSPSSSSSPPSTEKDQRSATALLSTDRARLQSLLEKAMQSADLSVAASPMRGDNQQVIKRRKGKEGKDTFNMISGDDKGDDVSCGDGRGVAVMMVVLIEGIGRVFIDVCARL